MSVVKLKLQKIKLKDYQVHPDNPRIDIKSLPDFYDSLKYSIDTYGYVEPVVVNAKTKRIISGHQRVQILLEKGINEIDAIVLNISEKDEKVLMLALNKISGKWDYNKLGKLLKSLETKVDTTRLGFDDSILAVLIEQFDMQKVIIEKREQALEQVKSKVINGRFGNFSFKVDPSVYTKFLKALETKKPDEILRDGLEKFNQLVKSNGNQTL